MFGPIVNRSLVGSARRIPDTPDYFEYTVAETAVEIFS